jgi:hypothetical protein
MNAGITSLRPATMSKNNNKLKVVTYSSGEYNIKYSNSRTLQIQAQYSRSATPAARPRLAKNTHEPTEVHSPRYQTSRMAKEERTLESVSTNSITKCLVPVQAGHSKRVHEGAYKFRES